MNVGISDIAPPVASPWFGMPNYRGLLGHRNQTLALVGASLLVPLVTWDVRDGVVALGVLAGLKVSPDMDLNARVLGRLGEWGFVDEYAELVPHRHWISHSAILSTAIRFALVFGIPLLAAWGIGLPIPVWALWRFFVGLALADALHVLADRVFTRVKSGWRRAKRPFVTQVRRKGKAQSFFKGAKR